MSFYSLHKKICEVTMINCHAHPYDLRPAIRASVDGILRQYKKVGKNELLYVPIGENHSQPTSILLRLEVIKELKDKKIPFLYAHECSHDMFAKALDNSYGPIPQNYKHDFNKAVHSLEGHREMALKYLTSFARSPSAPNTHIYFLTQILKNNIPTIFNDASIQNIQSNSDEGFDPDLCLEYRNRTMIQLAFNEATKMGVRLIIQGCGETHTAGAPYRLNDKPNRSIFDKSLIGLAHQNPALRIYPIFLTYPESIIDLLYAGAGNNFPQQKMVVNGLASDNFAIEKIPTEREAKYIYKVLNESGLTMAAADVYNFQREAMEHGNDLRANAQQIFDNAKNILVSNIKFE